MAIALAAILASATPGAVSSEACSEPSCQSRDAHGGLNLRTDFGTHPIRVDGGVRFGSIDLYLVLDPMVWLDSQADLDLVVDFALGRGWSVLAGWRATSIGILGGRQWQQKSLTGVAARLPSFAGGHLRGQWGLELAVLWVKHGGGLDSEWISLDSPRDWLDHLNFGMFVRFEYASAF
jgi:hypothetical protein